MSDLTIAPAEGSQAATQNPQTVPTAKTINGASVSSGGVQPVTGKDILNSQIGQNLHATALTTVSLADTSASTAAPARVQHSVQKPAHHANPVLLGFSIALVLAAIVVFWAMARSAKNTTD